MTWFLLALTPAYISVVKSRLQAGSEDASKYRSSLDGLLTILREEGIEGLYKGVGSKLLQSVLTAAILFAGQRRIFELTKSVSMLYEFKDPQEGVVLTLADFSSSEYSIGIATEGLGH